MTLLKVNKMTQIKTKFYFQMDGTLLSEEVKKKFFLEDRDWRSSKEGRVSNFVGFIIKRNKILVSFPKHYCSEYDLKNHENKLDNKDIRILFKTLLKSNIEDQFTNFNGREEYASSYPFTAFYQILDYYKRYGLYNEVENYTKAGYDGKIVWKDTIRKSSPLISNGNLLYVPFYVKQSKENHTFLTECMIYALAYTIQMFPFFIDEKVPFSLPRNLEFWKRTDHILNRLRKLKQEVFKDIHKKLVDNLILFFDNKDKKGDIIIKHYKFENVWEDLVQEYLESNFKTITIDGPQFETGAGRLKFVAQKSFNDVDSSNNQGYEFRLDHYYSDDQKQYIFDSKYYQSINGINYKQLSYHMVLQNNGRETYSMLILPTEKEDYPRKHFDLSPLYQPLDSDGNKQSLVIWEYYVNIKKAMMDFTKYHF